MAINRRGENIGSECLARENIGDILAEVHPQLEALFRRPTPGWQASHFETEILGVVGPDGTPVACYGVSLFRHDSGMIGADLLDLPPHCRFPLHVHPGHHILLCLDGAGTFSVGDVDYDVVPGDVVMVEGNTPHAVGAGARGQILMAIGAPHKPLDSEERMTLVDGSGFEVTRLETATQTAARVRLHRGAP